MISTNMKIQNFEQFDLEIWILEQMLKETRQEVDKIVKEIKGGR